MTEYQQLVSIARRQGRSLPEIAAAWRSANVRLYRNPRDPGRQARLERERRTGRYLSQGVSFTRALQLAARERNPLSRNQRIAAGQLELPEGPSAAEQYRQRQAELRAEIDRLRDETPNLRDFGLDRRDEFERAIAAHGRRLRELNNERERLGYEFRGLPVPERFRNPRRRRPGAGQQLEPDRPNPARLDWRALLALGGLAWLVFRHASGQAPAISLGTRPSAPASSGPIATGQMITYEAWWVKWRNGGQNPPVSMDFPPLMVLDAPDQGAGVPIPAGSPRGG